MTPNTISGTRNGITLDWHKKTHDDGTVYWMPEVTPKTLNDVIQYFDPERAAGMLRIRITQMVKELFKVDGLLSPDGTRCDEELLERLITTLTREQCDKTILKQQMSRLLERRSLTSDPTLISQIDTQIIQNIQQQAKL